MGTGAPSDPSNAVTPATVPDAPTNVTAVAGNGEVTVSWTAPTSDGGSAITDYTVTSSPGGLTASVDGSTTTATVTGLTNGTNYTFTVAATNAMGTSAPSSPSNAVTPATVPGQATGVTATAGNAQATVSWSAPASDGGSAITAYTATSNPGGLTASVGGGATTATVTGLTNGTAYTFTVTATNAVGTGAPPDPSNAVTPATVPGPPTGVTAVAGDAQATVSWAAPTSDGGSAITAYTATSIPGGLIATAGGSATSTTATGLTNGTAYTFVVVATNRYGDSAPSTASSAVIPSGVTASLDAPTSVGPGATFTVRVDISQVTNFDTAWYYVDFDPAVLTIDSVADGSIGGTSIRNYAGTGAGGPRTVVVNMPGTGGVSGSGFLSEINFRAIGGAGTFSAIDLTNLLLGDTTAREIPSTFAGAVIVNVGVAVRADAPATVLPGVAFDVPVNITDVTDLDAASYEVRFDSAVLELASVTAGTVGTTAIPVSATDDIEVDDVLVGVRVAQSVSGTAGVSGSGSLAVLHFTFIGKSGESSSITLMSGLLSDKNTNEIYVNWYGDSVAATLVVGDATGDGILNALDITRIELDVAAGLSVWTTPGVVTEAAPGADANEDGYINSLDITRIELLVAGEW